MKKWIEKRVKEMKAKNVIQLPNWADYYNNLDNLNHEIRKNIETRNKLTEVLYAYAQTLTDQSRSKASDYNRKRT